MISYKSLKYWTYCKLRPWPHPDNINFMFIGTIHWNVWRPSKNSRLIVFKSSLLMTSPQHFLPNQTPTGGPQKPYEQRAVHQSTASTSDWNQWKPWPFMIQRVACGSRESCAPIHRLYIYIYISMYICILYYATTYYQNLNSRHTNIPDFKG